MLGIGRTDQMAQLGPGEILASPQAAVEALTVKPVGCGGDANPDTS